MVNPHTYKAKGIANFRHKVFARDIKQRPSREAGPIHYVPTDSNIIRQWCTENIGQVGTAWGFHYGEWRFRFKKDLAWFTLKWVN